MLVRALQLRHFRNLSSVDLSPNPRFNIFSGPNGQGKTNLLEALFLLSAVKSFRPQTNAELIEFEHTSATLAASVERGGQERIVKIEVNERGKKVYLNNNQVRQLSSFFGTLNVVMFGPEDISLMKGSPSGRRRFIDRAIFNAQPAYATESMHYEEVLKQRNALLKSPQGADRNLLAVYDEQLIQYGASLIERRYKYLQDFKPVFEATFQDIFDAEFEAAIDYQLGWPHETIVDADATLTSRTKIEGLLADAIARTSHEERDRGHTLVGPHRDDLYATLNGKDLKAFASQGQHRAFVLAMKIAEIAHLEERYRFAPILLLDDVSSELDRERNRYLFDFLRNRMEGQVFITTTHRDYILLDEDVSVFHVKHGEVSSEEEEEDEPQTAPPRSGLESSPTLEGADLFDQEEHSQAHEEE